MDIRSYFSPSAKASLIDDEADFVKVKKKKSSKRKGVLFDSDSDEEPIPKSVRKQLDSSNIILDSDEEKKNTKSKLGKSRKKQVKQKPTLETTTPSAFFGSFGGSSSNKGSEKRKASEELPAKAKIAKKSEEDLIVIDDIDNSNEVLKSEKKPKSQMLSTKLLETTSTLNGKKEEKRVKIAEEKPKTKSSKKSELSNQQQIKKKVVKSRSPAKITPKKEPKLAKEEPKEKPNLQKKEPKLAEKVKTKVKEQSSLKESKKEAKTPDKTKTEKPAASDKQSRFLKYQQWQNRAGPSAPGSKEVPKGQDFCMEGMTFVITGVQESLSRDEIKSLVERYGGKVTTSVSSRTSYLITGSDPGESKLKKAEQHRTKIIDEDQFLDLIRTLPGKKSKYEIVENTPTKKSAKATKQSNSANKPVVKSEAGEKSDSKTETPLQKLSSTAKSDDAGLMWVDKYKPSTIKHIIGQQGGSSNVNKLLNWLRNWDKNNRTAEGKAKPKPKFNPWGGGDPTGASFKAALLSGPPGVGKTTTATLVCKELGLSYVELNASDQRSKRILQEDVLASVQNTNLSNLFAGEKSGVSTSGSAHVLIMDEVDGMAGNEDRGGMQELIQIIKNTKIPIICMCNDRSSQKMRSLVNYCFDLRFQRPRVEQITSAVMSICFKEGLKVQAPAVQAIIRSCNQDIRQVLHNLNMLKASDASLSYDDAKSHADRAQKDVNLGVFEIARKLLSESSSLSLLQKSDLFFMDYSMVPKFVQENYVNISPFAAKGNAIKHLQLLSKAADSIASGDIIEGTMRHDQSWSMLPTLGLLSTVIPCDHMRGAMQGMINFPSFFGKLSTTGKNRRLLQELKFHSSLGTGGCTEENLNLDLVPYLRVHLTQPLLRQSRTGEQEVSKATKLLDDYDLTREDFDSLMEVGQFQGKANYMSQVDSKVKAAFTRTYNKESHLTPYAVESAATKKKKKAAPIDYDEDGLESTQNDEVEEDDNDLEVDGMIKQAKKATTSKSRAKKPNKNASTSKKGKK